MRVLPFKEEYVADVVLKILPQGPAFELVIYCWEPLLSTTLFLVHKLVGILKCVIHDDFEYWVNHVEYGSCDENSTNDCVPFIGEVTVLAVKYLSDRTHEI